MVILMKSNKTLVLSKNSKLYQKENAVDNITIYVPETYNDHDLKEFVATLFYTLPGNEACSDTLIAAEESDKEGFIKYSLPITTKITNLSGVVSLYLSMVHVDLETDTKYILKTNTLDVVVEKWSDYFKYVTDDSLTAIDNKIAELDTRIAEIKAIAETTIPDDLSLTEAGNLRLSVEGTPMGNGVNIVVTSEDTDGTDDGVIDLDVVGI